jgi:hypothetical protein
MLEKVNVEKFVKKIKKEIPAEKVSTIRQLELLEKHINKLEDLISDLIEGCEVDEFNQRAEDLLSCSADDQGEWNV